MGNILLFSPVRQKKEIFKLFIEGLKLLKIPKDYSLDRLLLLHNSQELIDLIPQSFCNIQELNTDEEYEVNEQGHVWKNNNLSIITSIKNGVFDYVRKNSNIEYLFIVDSDLILNPLTLQYLLQAKQKIVSEIFWTKWKKNIDEMPNAWDLDFYTFFNDTMEKYRKKGVYECGGTGACILIHRHVIEAGVNFNPVACCSWWGEDRAFMVRSHVAGFKTFVDTHAPAFHIYRESDIEEGVKKIEEYKNGNY